MRPASDRIALNRFVTASLLALSLRAVGIATLVFGFLQSMCFTPIEPVLDALNATLVTTPQS